MISLSFEERDMPRKRKNCNDNNSFTIQENLIFNRFYVICDSMTAEVVCKNQIHEDTIVIKKIFFDHNFID